MNLADLKKPFPYEDIEWRAGATNSDKTKALALAYITSRAVMDRLDEVCGPEHWHNAFLPGPSGGVICGISIKIPGSEWITKWDGADNSDIESVKGGLSDAFKRAGVQWGVGRYLYNLDGTWVKCEQRGKTVVLTEKPQLPTWALPVNTKAPTPRPAPVATGQAAPPKPTSAPVPLNDKPFTPPTIEPAAMSLETASAVINSKQQAYGTLDDKALASMIKTMQGKVDENAYSGDELTEVRYKMAACRTILNSRK